MVPNEFARAAQDALDRLKMIQQIPEPGLIVLASQSGRCALCSTERKDPERRVDLRVDWALPMKKQEDARFRPPHALLGIAVRPIQGGGEKEHQAEDGAFENGTIHGTPTIFDKDVVLLDSSEEESTGGDIEYEAKRLNMPASHFVTIESHLRKEQPAWSQATSLEWRGVNYIRRNNLMLKYYD